MTTRNRGQVRRRTRPTVDASAHEELELDDYDAEEVTPISRAERRREERRRDRAGRRKKIIIKDEPAEPIWIELGGQEYLITPPDMGLILDMAEDDGATPRDQLTEWIDEAFEEEDADEVIDKLQNKRLRWGSVSKLMQAVMAETGKNPTG